MRSIVRALLFLIAALSLASSAIADGPSAEARALYQRFAAAQNDHDLAAVRALLSDSPQFLWVSNGMSYWGADTMVARMASFQRAEVWRVEPDLDAAVAVEVNAGAAYLHLPLTLVIGRADAPSNLRFLVSMLAQETDDGWRIAALFTTNENPG
jgi:uncharacterized protein (TIGR02246 family)